MNAMVHAHLAMKAYDAPSFKPDGSAGVVNTDPDRQEQFIVVHHMDTPSGYQGSVYQHIKNGAYVVAHRGTEFERQMLKDGLVDLGMVTAKAVRLMPLLALLAACGSTEPARPPYEPNPAPREAHEVVVTVKDAPEDIYLSSAYVSYSIANHDCLGPIDNFEGVRYNTEYSLDIPLRQMSDQTFTGTYFRDGVLSKDYYGQGVCTWKAVLVGAILETEATRSFTYFSISTMHGQTAETLFSKKDIRPVLDDGHRYPANGTPADRFMAEVPELERGNFFAYSISTRNLKVENEP